MAKGWGLGTCASEARAESMCTRLLESISAGGLSVPLLSSSPMSLAINAESLPG